MDPLIERQVSLEDECMSLGVNRYRRESAPWGSGGESTARPESQSIPGTFLVSRALDAVSAQIKAFLDDTLAPNESGRTGPKRNLKAARWLSNFDPDVIAMASLQVGVDSMTAQYTLTRAASRVATLLESQHDHDGIKAENVRYYQAVMKDSDPLHKKRKRVAEAARKFGVSSVALSQTDRIKYGRIPLQMMMERTGICEMKLENKPGSNKKSYRLRATARAEAWLEERHSEYERMFPILLPMLVEPKPWTSPFDGGYITSQMTGLKLVKTSRVEYLDELNRRDLSPVYSAVNTVQSTPWRINKPVLDALKSLWERGGTTAGLPKRDPYPLPARPEDIDTNEESLRNWKREAAKTYEANAKLVSQRAGTAQKIWIAEKFADEQAIYFPHCLDWRGRVYPIPMLVHPQGDDLARGLLTFAAGVELGEDGAKWLAVHVANVWGEDKLSFDDRIRWVYDNEDMILDSAESPLGGLMEWTEADSPFQALAAALEWAEYRKVGDTYVSHLPVALDGSCSGLQHFSAMLRDSRGGAAVNLLPSDVPSDIYSEVSAEVSRRVEQLADEGDEMGCAWRGRIDRSGVKRPTMTQPYGVTAVGINAQTEEYLDKAKRDGAPVIDPEIPSFQAARWLGPIISESIGRIVTAAPAVMDWMKNAARIAAKDGLPIRWTTPVGFPVMHAYRKNRLKRVQAWFGDSWVTTSVNEPLAQLDKRRQAAGISPNFVHSMDASHLMLTVNLSRAEGIQDFAMIHDSFGTHAGNTMALAVFLREAFVEQYTEDRLAEFRDQLIDQLPESLAAELPPLPDTGDLDITDVLESDYFFA